MGRVQGVVPHRDFKVLEKLFGDVGADACDATIPFGLDGEPAYISGPHDLPVQARFGVGTVKDAIVGRIGQALLEKQGSDAV